MAAKGQGSGQRKPRRALQVAKCLGRTPTAGAGAWENPPTNPSVSGRVRVFFWGGQWKQQKHQRGDINDDGGSKRGHGGELINGGQDH